MGVPLLALNSPHAFFAEEKCFFPIGNALSYLLLILRLQKYEDLFWPAIEELLVKHREIFLMF